MSLLVQYIILFVILAAAVAWVIWRLTRKDRGNVCNCGNCDASANCKMKEIVKKQKNS